MPTSTSQIVDATFIKMAEAELLNRYLCVASLTVRELWKFTYYNTITLFF